MIRRLWRRLMRRWDAWWNPPAVSDRWLREMRRQQVIREIQPPESRGPRR